MVRGEAISKQFHTKIQCHSFIHSFIHSFLLQTGIASVLYTRQHACKKGGMTQRLPRQASGTHLGEASWSIRMKARGTKLRGWLSRSYKPVWLPEQAGNVRTEAFQKREHWEGPGECCFSPVCSSFPVWCHHFIPLGLHIYRLELLRLNDLQTLGRQGRAKPASGEGPTDQLSNNPDGRREMCLVEIAECGEKSGWESFARPQNLTASGNLSQGTSTERTLWIWFMGNFFKNLLA